MEEQHQTEAEVYEPPMLEEVGEFDEVTLGPNGNYDDGNGAQYGWP